MDIHTDIFNYVNVSYKYLKQFWESRISKIFTKPAS